MGIQYAKVKSAGKVVLAKSDKLESVVLQTMKTISDLVGATLGPGGHSVLLERQEDNLPNFVTKDGVTVFRSLGFQNPIAHAIMESARDASVRTASEAGDGTTTATILAYAIVKNINDTCKANPQLSPQRIIRQLHSCFKETVEPAIRGSSIACNFATQDGQRLLWNVAKISANGDDQLADAVMKCYHLVGDSGNVTITEVSGPMGYEVEKIEGYPVNVGYEDSCGRYYPKFVNDPASQRVYLEKPVFVIYHGRITEIQTVQFLMERIGLAWQNDGYNNNVILVATGFSESVISQLAANFVEPTTINVFPLLAPMNAIPNSQGEFLGDLAAITGAQVYDPISFPLPRTHEEVDLASLGHGIEYFEATRFRSTVVGQCDEVLTLERVDRLEKQLAQSSASILESTYLTERIGRLTGGIAKLKIVGASNGELRERRDRAEDAVLAVRKAVEYGALPGGGWMLLRLAQMIEEKYPTHIADVLAKALYEPFFVLFRNLGWTDEQVATSFLQQVKKSAKESQTTEAVVYDALEAKYVNAIEGGVLDSVPAVLEAIRNSLSIASLLGTLGGVVVFPRNAELELAESRANAQFQRDIEAGGGTYVNEANERA